ncbi:MAG TPA: tetratricopeptide repeat protein, partial [Methylomirabilota bacterium]|nr:tetratricopeptide repeat protein [Methylomirabilota bacterium]
MPSRFVWLWLSVASIFIGAGCAPVHHNAPGRRSAQAAEQKDSGPSDSPDQYDKRAEVHAHFLAGLSFEQNRELEKALAEYEKALAGDPKNEMLAVDLSRRYLQRKEFDKAIAVLKKAAQAGTSGLMYARLSLVYLQQGKTNAAIDASRAAIKHEPGSMAGYQSLFHLYRSLGQTNDARKAVEQAARQPKPDAPFLIDLAHLYLAIDAEDLKLTNSPSRVRAKQLLTRAATMENTNIVSLQRLAQGFIFVGDTKRAASIYAKMLKEEPDLIGIREALAELYQRDNDPGSAAEQLKEIIRDTPTNPQAYYFLGAIAYEERRFSEALDHYRKALLLGLDNQQMYFDIASTHLALRQPRDALDWLEKARR